MNQSQLWTSGAQSGIIYLITPGMSRADVEALLAQPRGGVQGREVTIYPVAPGVTVEVCFDTLNGRSEPRDRVRAPAQLFVSGDDRNALKYQFNPVI